MSATIVGIAGRVHKDGSLPPAPTGSSLEYTAKLDQTSGVYTVTFTVPFSEAPSVLVTDYDSNLPAGVDPHPLVAPKVYGITPSSFSVMFWEFIPASGGNLNEFVFLERYFSFAALEITSKKKG
jgi:hypothetical protein